MLLLAVLLSSMPVLANGGRIILVLDDLLRGERLLLRRLVPTSEEAAAFERYLAQGEAQAALRGTQAAKVRLPQRQASRLAPVHESVSPEEAVLSGKLRFVEPVPKLGFTARVEALLGESVPKRGRKALDEVFVVDEARVEELAWPETRSASMSSWHEALRAAEQPTLVVRSLERLGTLRSFIAADPVLREKTLVVLQRSKKPLQGVMRLARTPEKTSVLYDLPSTRGGAENGRSGRVLSRAELERIQRYEERLLDFDVQGLQSVERLPVHEGSTMAESALVRLRASSEEDLTLIISHQEGGALRFLDGSSVPLGQVVATGDVVLVGCNTLKGIALREGGFAVAMADQISLESGVSFVEETLRLVGMGASLRDLLLLAQSNPKLRFAVGVVSITVVVVPTASMLRHEKR